MFILECDVEIWDTKHVLLRSTRKFKTPELDTLQVNKFCYLFVYLYVTINIWYIKFSKLLKKYFIDIP